MDANENPVNVEAEIVLRAFIAVELPPEIRAALAEEHVLLDGAGAGRGWFGAPRSPRVTWAGVSAPHQLLAVL